jgi:hypothetical protein
MTDASLQVLLDKSALDDLIYTQAMALDQRDWPTYRTCFADVVDFDFSEHIGRVTGQPGVGIATDPDAWVENVRSCVPGFDATMHSVTNVVHKVAGDQAKSDCLVTAEHFLNNDSGDRSITASGIYNFQSIRTPAGWKLKTWRLKVLWYRGNPSLYLRAAEKVRDGSGK